MSPRRALLAALAVLALLPAAARADEAPPPPDTNCTGKVSGAATGGFACKVNVTVGKDGVVSFEVKATGPVAGLKSLAPITFGIASPVTIQTYAHRDLARASAKAVTTAGKTFHATEKLGDRGDVEVTVETLDRTRRINLALIRVHAHLVPADAKDRSEIQLDVQLFANW